MTYAIETSCQSKANVVSADEKEQGQRALLNLGHTFGHAIETGMGYGEWLHGEAVATGMVMAAKMSSLLGWLSDTDVAKIETLIIDAKLPVKAPDKISPDQFSDLMSVDKKVIDGVLRLVLLKSIGHAIVTSDYETDKMIETINGSYA